MQIRETVRLAVFGGAAFLLALGPAGGWTTAQAPGQDTPPGGLAGVLEVLWGDGPPGSGLDDLRLGLTAADGTPYVLSVDAETLEAAGGLVGLNRQPVVVSGTVVAPGISGPDLEATVDVATIRRAEGPGLAMAERITGAVPWVSILCKFSDVGAEPKSKAYLEGLMGGASPGLDFYWREASEDRINIVGSTVVGWVTLPQPRSHYVYDNGSGVIFDFTRATTDCTALADPVVHFPSFDGIQMLFNADLDGFAWGGSRFLSLDGVFKQYSTTWYPPWGYANQSPIAHEMGHGMGLPHSSGPYGATYDSEWDVMSDAWVCGVNSSPTYGCLAQHTIAYHKDQLGWIPANRQVTVSAGRQVTVDLVRLAVPPAGDMLLVKVPISGTSRYYTVERREQVFFDAAVPGSAVVIHEVDPFRSRPANVVDPDGNGNPNDAGARWTQGESFVDADAGIRVTVGAGLEVTVVNLPSSAAYVLDGLGGVHHGGTGTAPSPASPYFGFDVARDVEFGATGFHVLDGFGGLHAGGGATVKSPASPYFGFDVARDVELTASGGFHVLDGFGGVHTGGGAAVMSPAAPYFGFDIARDLELGTTGYHVLDGFGGVHTAGGAPVMSPATPYFGFDVAVDLEFGPTGYYVLDGFGGVHAGGGAPVMSPATPYFGTMQAADLEIAVVGYYVLDVLGTVHAGGGASPFSPATPYFGVNVARDLELR